MGSALLCILRPRLLVYTAGSGVNRVQVVLSGFSMRLFCFVQAKTLCRYGCIYFLAALVLVCGCDGDVICVGHDLNRLLLYAFRDLWKEWGDSNFQIFSHNCEFHHRRMESLEHFNVLFVIYHSEHYDIIFGP